MDAPGYCEEVDKDGYGTGCYHHVGWPKIGMLVASCSVVSGILLEEEFGNAVTELFPGEA